MSKKDAEYLEKGYKVTGDQNAGHQPGNSNDAIKGHQPSAPTNQGKPPSGGSGVKPPANKN